jgi:hypothetical protein
MKVEDAEIHDWFVDVLKAKVGAVQKQEIIRLEEIRRRTTRLEEKQRRLLTLPFRPSANSWRWQSSGLAARPSQIRPT